jgi:hypothetical protein
MKKNLICQERQLCRNANRFQLEVQRAEQALPRTSTEAGIETNFSSKQESNPDSSISASLQPDSNSSVESEWQCEKQDLQRTSIES